MWRKDQYHADIYITEKEIDYNAFCTEKQKENFNYKVDTQF